MKLGILHLSDLHIGTITPEINTLNSLVCSLKYKIQNITDLLIIISGDIAQSGKKEEYELAFDYFMHLEAGFLKQREDLNIRFIVSPGNHDFENRPNDDRDSLIAKELKKGFP